MAAKRRKSGAARTRTRDKRALRRRILVVCDGQTERDYFAYLRRMLRNVATLDVQLFKYDLKDFRLPPNFDEIWCVFDKDDRKNETFDKFIQKARKRKWIAGWSNPCFELWLELHFSAVKRRARDQRDQTRRWAKCLEKELGGNSGKRLKDPLMEALYRRLPVAIGHARQLFDEWENDEALPTDPSRQNPCTMVFLLAERVQALQQSHQ